MCVQVRAQIQLGKVLFPLPRFAAALVTNPQSFIHIRTCSFYMQDSVGALVRSKRRSTETHRETEAGAFELGNVALTRRAAKLKQNVGQVPRRECVFDFFLIFIHRSTIYTA